MLYGAVLLHSCVGARHVDLSSVYPSLTPFSFSGSAWAIKVFLCGLSEIFSVLEGPFEDVSRGRGTISSGTTFCLPTFIAWVNCWYSRDHCLVVMHSHVVRLVGSSLLYCWFNFSAYWALGPLRALFLMYFSAYSVFVHFMHYMSAQSTAYGSVVLALIVNLM